MVLPGDLEGEVIGLPGAAAVKAGRRVDAAACAGGQNCCNAQFHVRQLRETYCRIQAAGLLLEATA